MKTRTPLFHTAAVTAALALTGVICVTTSWQAALVLATSGTKVLELDFYVHDDLWEGEAGVDWDPDEISEWIDEGNDLVQTDSDGAGDLDEAVDYQICEESRSASNAMDLDFVADSCGYTDIATTFPAGSAIIVRSIEGQFGEDLLGVEFAERIVIVCNALDNTLAHEVGHYEGCGHTTPSYDPNDTENLMRPLLEGDEAHVNQDQANKFLD